MRYRTFGSTGLTISEIGFGAWGIGGTPGDARAYGPTDDRESIAALQRAFEVGVTLYDTSPLYGYGHSEELIGRALSEVRDRIVISTKAGYQNFKGEQDFTPGQLRSSLEASLKRLRTEYVDIFQLHDPPMQLLAENPAVMEMLASLHREGKIRCIGISTKSPAESMVAVDQYGVGSVQVNFSLVDQRALELGLFRRCHAAGAGLIARTPLCFGFLSGRYQANDDYAPGDHRALWKKEQIACWAEAYKLFAAQLSGAEGQTNAQIALRYVLSFPEVSTTIPGMLNVGQVEENAAASDLGPFPPEVLEKFAQIYQANRFFI